MGNQSSSSTSPSTTLNSGVRSEKLLRRNKRTAYHANPSQQQMMPTFAGGGAFPSEARTNRSRSLEPQCAEAVKVIEHSQSARYPRNRRIREKNNFLSPESAAILPEEKAEAGN